MKLSVIIPVYNGHSFIISCLDSILKQQVKDIEIIIVNDGSTDDSRTIAENYISVHPSIDIKLINKTNAGLPQARKTGVECSSGDFIGFVDVDDWIEAGMYASMLDKITDTNSDIACCAYQMDFINRHQIIKNDIGNRETLTGAEAIDYLHRRTAVYPYAWNKIYRKSLFESISFPRGNFVGEDYTIVTQLLINARKVVVIPYVGYHYVQVENSMCRGGYNSSYAVAFQNYMEISGKLEKQYPEYMHSIRNYVITEYMAIIIAMGKNSTYDFTMIRNVQTYVQNNLKYFIKDKDVPLIMKGSALAVSTYWRALPAIYNLLRRIRE